jgi:hypothetical protein
MEELNENNDNVKSNMNVNVTFPFQVSCPCSICSYVRQSAVYVKWENDSRFVFVLNAGRMLSLYSNFSTPLVRGQGFRALTIVCSSCICPGIRNEPIYTNAVIVVRSIKLNLVSMRARMYGWDIHTGVRKDSATKRALAFNW